MFDFIKSPVNAKFMIGVVCIFVGYKLIKSGVHDIVSYPSAELAFLKKTMWEVRNLPFGELVSLDDKELENFYDLCAIEIISNKYSANFSEDDITRLVKYMVQNHIYSECLTFKISSDPSLYYPQ
jgi:hypothetical protein